MRALALFLLAVGCTSGCGGSSPANDGGDTTDAAVASSDLATTSPDMAHGMVVGIACGDTPCAANAQFCCTSDSGKTGMCGFGNDAASCGGSLFYCDGPEDCAPATPYCCIYNAHAICTDAPCPGTQEEGIGLCHSNTDCEDGFVCCSKSTTPYELCLTLCP